MTGYTRRAYIYGTESDRATERKTPQTKGGIEVANLIRLDPFGDIRSTMDRLFDEGFSRPWRLIGSDNSQPAEHAFPVEVSETDEAIDVKASLPGVKPDEVEYLVRTTSSPSAASTARRRPRTRRTSTGAKIRYGSFHRSLALPTRVDADKAEAKFENGILTLHLPKAETNRPEADRKVSAGNDVVSTQ